MNNDDYIFDKNNSFSSIPSKTDKITNTLISDLYWGTTILKLPDIRKWNTKYVIDMSFMFSGCTSLISLPDISKWNTENVEKMSDLFSYCSSL